MTLADFMFLHFEMGCCLFLSLGRCDEFSLDRFLFKTISGCVYALQSHTQTHAQALDESLSVSNEGISFYNELEEDPILETL